LCIGIRLLETLSLIVLGQASIARRAVILFGVVTAALARMHDAGVHALLGQALSAIPAFAGHGLAAALNVATMSPGARPLLILQGMLAAVHMACGALLHLLCVVARIVHILLAELALHGGLLRSTNGKPT
jgi:hypothetical protein